MCGWMVLTRPSIISGKRGDLGDVGDGDSRLAKQTRGAACGDELSALRDEAAGEVG